MEEFRKLTHQKGLQGLFSKIDADKSGSFSLEELKNFLYPNSRQGSHENDQVESLFKLIDLNGDGKVSCEEFLRFVICCKMGLLLEDADPGQVAAAMEKMGSKTYTLLFLCSCVVRDEKKSHFADDEEKMESRKLALRLNSRKSQITLEQFTKLYGNSLDVLPDEGESVDEPDSLLEVDISKKVEKIKETFLLADEDCDGVLSREELKMLIDACGEWSDEEYEQLFAQIDKNSDERIQEQEFIEWVMTDAKQHGILQEDLHGAAVAIDELDYDRYLRKAKEQRASTLSQPGKEPQEIALEG